MPHPDPRGVIECPHCGTEFTVDGWGEALDFIESMLAAWPNVTKKSMRDFLKAHGRLT